MRVPRLRFTVRRMMVAVAIVAVLIGGWRHYQRFMKLSLAYSGQAGQIEMEIVHPKSVMNQAKVEAILKKAHWHDAVALKYRRVASRPWLLVTPEVLYHCSWCSPLPPLSPD